MALAVDDLGIEFDGKWVLEGVSLTFEPGRVHGLIGHNGSGKSTLIKILAGYHTPSAGTVVLDGASLTGADPATIHRLGLRFVHQDLGLIPEFTALENMGVGGTYSTGAAGAIDWKRQARRLRSVLETFGSEVPMDVPVQRLSAVQRSLVSIARAVETGADEETPTRLLVLDEPTTALEGPEVGHLFEVVGSLTGSGIGVLYVSHNLRDVLALSSSISVLRNGRHVATFRGEDVTHDQLVVAMLGEDLSAAQHPTQVRGPSGRHGGGTARQERPRLSVRGLRSDLLRGVDLDLAAGECVCVMGLSGSGREQLAYALAGAVPSENDALHLDGAVVDDLHPHTCRDHRVALVPGNRMPGSILSDFTMRENLSLVSLDRHRGWLRSLRRDSERATAGGWARRLEIRPDDTEYSTRNLSGGNKQKVILAKWLETDPLVMLIDEPTAGVDIGAAQKILGELRTLVNEGRSLLITSSELEDVIAVADRILVLNSGRVSHELVRGRDEITEQAILSGMNQDADATAAPPPLSTGV